MNLALFTEGFGSAVMNATKGRRQFFTALKIFGLAVTILGTQILGP